MSILDLDSPLPSSKPVDTPAKPETKERRSRKRSFSECRATSPKLLATPTKRRKSLEGYIVEHTGETPVKGQKIIRHVIRAEKQDNDVFELSAMDLRKFYTPPGRVPLRIFPDLSQDGEPSTPKTPFSDNFLDITSLKKNGIDDVSKRRAETPVKSRYEKDFESLASSLNFKRGKYENVKTIKCHEVRDLIADGQIPTNYALLDCRFEYEFYGGHLRTAVKCTTREDVEKVFGKYESQPSMKFILHCEHSACRAPRSADYLACLFSYYIGGQPEIFVMTGGYSKFWKLFHNEAVVDDTGKDKIFERKGYVKENSQRLKCRLFRQTVSEGWNHVLLSSVDFEDDCIETFC